MHGHGRLPSRQQVFVHDMHLGRAQHCLVQAWRNVFWSALHDLFRLATHSVAVVVSNNFVQLIACTMLWGSKSVQACVSLSMQAQLNVLHLAAMRAAIYDLQTACRARAQPKIPSYIT